MEINVYEVKENELERLEEGAWGATAFNIMLSSISVGLPSVMGAMTTPIKSLVFIAWIVLISGSMSIALVSGFFWIRTKKTSAALIKLIRERNEDYEDED